MKSAKVSVVQQHSCPSSVLQLTVTKEGGVVEFDNILEE